MDCRVDQIYYFREALDHIKDRERYLKSGMPKKHKLKRSQCFNPIKVDYGIELDELDD